MQAPSRTHRMTKVFGALAVLFIGALIVLTFARPVATEQIESWRETTSYPLEIANRNAVVHDGYLYNVGGRLTTDDSAAQDFVASARINDDGSLDTWVSQTPLPKPIYLHAVVASDRYLYVIGGWDNDNRLSSVYRAAFQAGGGLGTWIQISTLAEAVTLHQAVLVRDRIYVLGGFTDTFDTPAVYYATAGDSGVSAWTRTTNLPQPLYRHGAAATDTTVYVTGGYTGNPAPGQGISVNTVYYASVDSGGGLGPWETGPPLPEVRHYHQSVIHDGRLFVIGGTTDDEVLSSVLSAEIRSDGSLGSWRSEPELPEPLLRFAAVSVRQFGSDFIYVIGGINGNAVYRSRVHHSDPPPTYTPTPTPTATPIFLLQMKQDPNVWVAPGDKVTYSIAYAGNRSDGLTNLRIVGRIPDNVELVPDSVSSSDGSTVSVNGTQPGSTVVWTWPSMDADTIGSVSYQVVRPIAPTPPVPLALAITKSGPETAAADQEIEYTLNITNNAPLTITGLTVRDSVPAGATYVRGGTLADGSVRWQIPTLPPFASTSVTYVVTAQTTLVNGDYEVTAEGSIQVRGRRTIVTVVDGRPPPAGGDGLVIVNPGAVATWTSTVGQLQLSSNSVRNPEFGIYLPMIQRE